MPTAFTQQLTETISASDGSGEVFNPGVIGGLHFLEKQLLNILRKYVTDPGIDDPNDDSGTRHGAVRDAVQPFTATGDGLTANFVLTPPTGYETAPIVAIYNVEVDGNVMAYGFDYFLQYGDKFGPDAVKTTQIMFRTPPAKSSAITADFRYGLKIKTTDGKLFALGSFINTGFSRGAMPNPKIQVTVESDRPEPVGIGDNWDPTLQMGAYWHNVTFRITIMSLYADECKMLTDKVTAAIMRAQHDGNYFLPQMVVEQVINIDYDLDQKAHIRLVMVAAKAREVFG